MDPNHYPTQDEAQASLDQIAESRRAAAIATRRPAWIDVALATTVGATIALGTAGHLAVAAVVLLVGALVVTVTQRRHARGRGQLFDQRAIGARALRFAMLYAVLFVLVQFTPPEAWQPWYSLGVGLLTAVGSFAWLRWEDRYRIRRLTAGDYGRHDLL